MYTRLIPRYVKIQVYSLFTNGRLALLEIIINGHVLTLHDTVLQLNNCYFSSDDLNLLCKFPKVDLNDQNFICCSRPVSNRPTNNIGLIIR